MLEILVGNHHTASNSEITINFHYVHLLIITAFQVLSPNISNISELFQVAIGRGSLAWFYPNRLGSVLQFSDVTFPVISYVCSDCLYSATLKLFLRAARDTGLRGPVPSVYVILSSAHVACAEPVDTTLSTSVNMWLGRGPTREVWLGGMIRGYDSGYDSWLGFVGMLRGPCLRVSLYPPRLVTYINQTSKN